VNSPSYSAADAASLRQMLGILFFSQILSLGMLAIYWGLRSSAEILSAFVHDTDGNSFVNSPLHVLSTISTAPSNDQYVAILAIRWVVIKGIYETVL